MNLHEFACSCDAEITQNAISSRLNSSINLFGWRFGPNKHRRIFISNI